MQAHRHTGAPRLGHRQLLQFSRLVIQQSRIHPEIEIQEITQTDLQLGQLLLAHPADAGEALMRIVQVLERLHRDAKRRQHEAVRRPQRDGDDFLLDGKPMYVRAGREIHPRGHGAVAVQTEEVLGHGDGRGFLGVELARKGIVLDFFGDGVVVDGLVGLRGVRFGAADGHGVHGGGADVFGGDARRGVGAGAAM